jgi:hypothetical protein
MQIELTHDHTWTPRKALEEQVAKEDLLAWAKREDAPFKTIPDKVTKPWSLPTLYAVYSKIAL